MIVSDVNRCIQRRCEYVGVESGGSVAVGQSVTYLGRVKESIRDAVARQNTKWIYCMFYVRTWYKYSLVTDIQYRYVCIFYCPTYSVRTTGTQVNSRFNHGLACGPTSHTESINRGTRTSTLHLSQSMVIGHTWYCRTTVHHERILYSTPSTS